MNPAPAQGTTPPGIRSEEEAARWVRGMFGRVARHYDFLNHFLSLNIDRYWRARSARRLRGMLRRPGARVLDLCCGTGDWTLAMERQRGGGVIGSDFCHPMLLAAKRKLARHQSASVLLEADVLALPFPDASIDLIGAAFGFRNLASYEKGLQEMHRVLKPDGAAAILEFSQPPNPLFAKLYAFYSARVLPFAGGLISGDRSAYRYLPESVRKFPSPEQLAESFRDAGFSSVEFERMTGGIVALHIGFKP